MAISSLGSLDLGKTINNIDTSITSATKDTEKSSFDSIFESALNMIKDTQDLTNKAEEEEMKYALGYDNTLELLIVFLYAMDNKFLSSEFKSSCLILTISSKNFIIFSP